MTHPLVVEARKMLGVPFRHMGRSERALDCAGLCILAYQRATGKTVQDLKSYGREPWRDGLRSMVELNAGEPVEGPPQEGDVLLLRFKRREHHLGIVGRTPYGELSLIHTSGEQGRVVEQRLDDYWLSRICAIYRPEVSNG